MEMKKFTRHLFSAAVGIAVLELSFFAAAYEFGPLKGQEKLDRETFESIKATVAVPQTRSRVDADEIRNVQQALDQLHQDIQNLAVQQQKLSRQQRTTMKQVNALGKEIHNSLKPVQLPAQPQ